jgi:hypothetical protein
MDVDCVTRMSGLRSPSSSSFVRAVYRLQLKHTEGSFLNEIVPRSESGKNAVIVETVLEYLLCRKGLLGILNNE